MKGIEAVIIGPANSGAIQTTAGVISATGGTDQLMTQVDLSRYPLAREFILSGRLTGNTTSVGASKYLQLNWYWSDYNIASIDSTLVLANTLLLLAKRKFNTGPIALDNLTLANGGDVLTQFVPAITTPASTTTATITFAPGINPRLNVGDLITVSGGVVTGDGAQMQGTYAVAAVTQTSGANGQIITTATYTITSTTGTLVGATVQVANSIRLGRNDQPQIGIFRPLARYLLVSANTPAFTTNATLTLTVNLVRADSTDVVI